MILHAARGRSNARTARASSLHLDTVRVWSGRFAEQCLAGMADRRRCGRTARLRCAQPPRGTDQGQCETADAGGRGRVSGRVALFIDGLHPTTTNTGGSLSPEQSTLLLSRPQRPPTKPQATPTRRDTPSVAPTELRSPKLSNSLVGTQRLLTFKRAATPPPQDPPPIP
ncbi:hypothetical protein [Streptomyces canus]